MKFKKDSLRVGLFVSFGLLTFLFILFIILGYDFNDNRDSYIVRFNKLNGIKRGSEITLKGYVVGEVYEIIPAFGSDIYFKAEVKIDTNMHMYRGTTMVITNKNVIGDATLVIKLPDVKEILIKPNDTIFATDVQNLDELINQMSSLTGNLNKLVTSISSITGDNKAGIGQVIERINKILTRTDLLVANSEGSVVEILKNTAQTTNTIRKFAQEIRSNPLILLQGTKK